MCCSQIWFANYSLLCSLIIWTLQRLAEARCHYLHVCVQLFQEKLDVLDSGMHGLVSCWQGVRDPKLGSTPGSFAVCSDVRALPSISFFQRHLLQYRLLILEHRRNSKQFSKYGSKDQNKLVRHLARKRENK